MPVTYTTPSQPSGGMSEKEKRRQAQLKEIEAYKAKYKKPEDTRSVEQLIAEPVESLAPAKSAEAAAAEGTQRTKTAEEMVLELQKKNNKHPTEYYKK